MIHFVYAGEPGDHRIQAPYSITNNLYNFLAARAQVTYHRWDSHDEIVLGPDDVLLGHPHYDHYSCVQRAFRGPRGRGRCLIHPLHHGRPEDNLPFDHLARQADIIFSICGPYWYDTLERSPFAHWKSKIVRLDMAVDGDVFVHLKRRFNPVGQRRLVYIGSSIPNKNLQFLCSIMQAMPDVQLHWYGGSADHPLARLPNVRTTGWIVLDRMAAERIVRDCDIIVSVSDSDANPTTLLEGVAWGLIPACTRESGYYNDPMFTELYLHDLEGTVRQLRGLLSADGDLLLERSVMNRTIVEQRYNWRVFCETVWRHLCRLLQE